MNVALALGATNPKASTGSEEKEVHSLRSKHPVWGRAAVSKQRRHQRHGGVDKGGGCDVTRHLQDWRKVVGMLKFWTGLFVLMRWCGRVSATVKLLEVTLLVSVSHSWIMAWIQRCVRRGRWEGVTCIQDIILYFGFYSLWDATYPCSNICSDMWGLFIHWYILSAHSVNTWWDTQAGICDPTIAAHSSQFLKCTWICTNAYRLFSCHMTWDSPIRWVPGTCVHSNACRYTLYSSF